MNELSKKYNITVKFEDLPKSVLGLFIDVLGTPYIVINEMLHSDMHKFMFYSCLHFKKQGLGKIMITDLEKKDYEPFVYARNQLRE